MRLAILLFLLLGFFAESILAWKLATDTAQKALRGDEDFYLKHESSPSDPEKKYHKVPLDPAKFYAQLKAKKSKKRRKKRPKNKRPKKRTRDKMSGSFSGGGSKKGGGGGVDLAFLEPQPYVPEDSGCNPQSSVSAFTFLNFLMAAGMITANLVDNTNDNNRNNNNNNNDNNDNTNNFNVNNNNNNQNSNNMIMTPPGGKKRRRRNAASPLRKAIRYINRGQFNQGFKPPFKWCQRQTTQIKQGRFFKSQKIGQALDFLMGFNLTWLTTPSQFTPRMHHDLMMSLDLGSRSHVDILGNMTDLIRAASMTSCEDEDGSNGINYDKDNLLLRPEVAGPAATRMLLML